MKFHKCFSEVFRTVLEEFYNSDAYSEFLQEMSDASLMTQYGDAIEGEEGADYHVSYAEAVRDFIDWADPDCLRDRPLLTRAMRFQAEALADWWRVQGLRMIRGEHYITDDA